MKDFLLGALCAAIAITIIVLVKLLFGDLKNREDDEEKFSVEHEITPEVKLDFTNIMPEKIQIDNSVNYPTETPPPEIFTSPRISSFQSYIRR